MNKYQTARWIAVIGWLALATLGGCGPARRTDPAPARPDRGQPIGFRTVDDQTAQRLIAESMRAHPIEAAEPATPSGQAVPQAPERHEPVLSERTIEALPSESVAAGMIPQPPAEPIFDLYDPAIAEDTVSVDFNEVDIRTVLETVGDITGVNFIVDEKVAGKVTVMSPREIKVRELFDFLETILMVKGYTAVRSGEFVKVVPREQVIASDLLVRVGGDPGTIPINDTLATQIIPLKYADTTEVMNILKPLAKDAHIDSYGRINAILITDASSNIHRLARIIQQLDVPGAQEQITVIPLRYASAQTLSGNVMAIMEQAGRAGTGGPRTAAAPLAGRSRLKILPDTHINGLIVVGSQQEVQRVRQIVAQLDVERPQGAINAHVHYLEHAPAEDVAKAITAAWANLQKSNTSQSVQPVQISPDTGTNSLIITASAQDYKVLKSIIEKLDIVREQVLVELKILEISQDVLDEVGIDWQTLDRAVSNHIRGFGMTNYGLRVDHAAGNLEGLQIGAYKDIGGDTELAAILYALEKDSGVNILSTPHIMTTNHKSAKIVVGDNIPYVTNSRVTETDPGDPTVIQTYDYKDVGITLNITPHVNQGGIVRLEVENEFTKLIEGVSGLGSETPTTAKRQTETTVSMKSGTTVVIGGLIRDDQVVLTKKVPLLGDIPLLGELFKYRTTRKQKTNLLIFITPYILDSPQQLAEIRRYKQEELDRASEGLVQWNQP